jgi:hypothetical protein
MAWEKVSLWVSLNYGWVYEKGVSTLSIFGGFTGLGGWLNPTSRPHPQSWSLANPCVCSQYAAMLRLVFFCNLQGSGENILRISHGTLFLVRIKDGLVFCNQFWKSSTAMFWLNHAESSIWLVNPPKFLRCLVGTPSKNCHMMSYVIWGLSENRVPQNLKDSFIISPQDGAPQL